MKKLFYALILVFMLGALAACSNDNAEPENNDTEQAVLKRVDRFQLG